MRWPWRNATSTESKPAEPSSLDRILALMERRALEEQEVHEAERDVMLNELHRRLMAEEIEDSEVRQKAEARVHAAEAHGWHARLTS